MVQTREGNQLRNMQWNKIVDSLTYMTEAYSLDKAVQGMKHESEIMMHLMYDADINNYISQWLQLIHNVPNKKDQDTSKAFKLSGNQEFQAKNYVTSLELYTKSAIFAPSDSDELPIAIGNRSASLYQLNRWEDCIKNIKLALKLNYPAHLRHKLHMREAQCYLKLNKKKLAYEAIFKAHVLLTKIKPSINKAQMQMKLNDIRVKASRLKDTANPASTSTTENSVNTRNFTDAVDITDSSPQPVVAFGENPNFRCASAAIDLKESVLKGRHVVANRDIKQGQILFVEKAYTFVPLNKHETNYVCHTCCHTIVRDLCAPCTTCVDVFYCDVDCWEKARSYHCWECPGYQMNIWSQIGIGYLALKMLFASVLTTDLNRFNEAQGLLTNLSCLKQIAPLDIISYGLTATMLTRYLSNYTNFFETINIEEHLASKFSNHSEKHDMVFITEMDSRLFVSILLFKHILQLVANGHAISKLNAIKVPGSHMRIEEQARIATAIYPSASMMNHSCDPNIINSFIGDLLIVKAIRDIKEGQEVLHCYGPDFRRMLKTERQQMLRNQYCFKCTCEACTNSEYKFFMIKFRATKCPTCSGPLNVIVSPSWCMDCGKIAEIDYETSVAQSQAYFEEGVNLTSNDQHEEALERLMKCLSIRREVLYKFHDDVTITLDFIAKLYAKTEQWLNSIKYVEYSMMAIEERFGPMSIEICHELNKLTDICITYLQNEKKTETKFYKNILKKTRRYLNRTQEIIDLAYGSWSELHDETVMKKNVLDDILKNYNV